MNVVLVVVAVVLFIAYMARRGSRKPKK